MNHYDICDFSLNTFLKSDLNSDSSLLKKTLSMVLLLLLLARALPAKARTINGGRVGPIQSLLT